MNNYRVTIWESEEEKVWIRRTYLHAFSEEQAIEVATGAYFNETSRTAKYVTADIDNIR